MGALTLVKLLQEYTAKTVEEISFKRKMLAFIEQNDNCFERSLEIGHITASSWFLDRSREKALLMHHTKLDRWFQLGGHCDGNSDVLAVAIKETEEESGIKGLIPISDKIFDLDIHVIPYNGREKEHLHYDVRFLLSATTDDEIIKNRESRELRWVGKDIKELPTDNQSVVRMFQKWCSLF